MQAGFRVASLSVPVPKSEVSFGYQLLHQVRHHADAAFVSDDDGGGALVPLAPLALDQRVTIAVIVVLVVALAVVDVGGLLVLAAQAGHVVYGLAQPEPPHPVHLAGQPGHQAK